jgi:cobalamin biosynthesis protein CobD/CbiB
MPKKKSNTTDNKHKLKNIVELLRFALTLDDEEIVKSTVESVVELLEEEIDK